jgi:23S rRNA-/tRNA-specific pseudouridylate synthase
MVFARTAAHRTLNLQFERRKTQKAYHAIVVGNPKWDEHTLSPFQWGHFTASCILLRSTQ